MQPLEYTAAQRDKVVDDLCAMVHRHIGLGIESWENSKPAFSDKPPKRVEEYLYIFESGKGYVYNGYNCNGPLEDYLSPEISSKDDMISLPKNFCYYLHGYLSGLSSTQREDKGLDSIIKTLEGYLDV